MRIIALAAGLALAGCWQAGEDTAPDGTSPAEPATKRIVPQPETRKVDILVVVDDSRGTQEEQANFAASFPQLLRAILDPPLDPATGEPEHPPVTDLHYGVVGVDMGTGGYPVETCGDPVDGDDGVLRHEPSVSISGCASTYPPFLSYASTNPDGEAIEELATDAGCISTLGGQGCGFEQPLASATRALEHAQPGGPNAGFIRDDALLVVFFFSDEDDASVRDDPESETIFDVTRTDLGHLNLRTFHHPEMLEPVATYVEALGGLPHVVVELLVGVPPDPVCEGPGDGIPDCLDHPLMIEEIDPADPTRLRPSCNTSTGLAFPPTRFVQLAQGLGDRALVHSICTDHFGPVMPVLAARIHEELDAMAAASPPVSPSPVPE